VIFLHLLLLACASSAHARAEATARRKITHIKHSQAKIKNNHKKNSQSRAHPMSPLALLVLHTS
jgi:hypothetical protein